MIPAKSTTVSCATTAMRPKVTPAPPHSAAGAGRKLRIAVLRGLRGAWWRSLLRGWGWGGGSARWGGRRSAPHSSGLREASPAFSSRWTRRPRELKWPSGIFQGGAPGWKNDPPKKQMTSPPGCLQGVLWEEKKEGAPRTVGPPHPEPSDASLSGCREGMVSFPAGSSLARLPAQTIKPPKGPLQKGEPLSPWKCMCKK